MDRIQGGMMSEIEYKEIQEFSVGNASQLLHNRAVDMRCFYGIV